MVDAVNGYPSNSHKEREAAAESDKDGKEKLGPVASGKQRKKPLGRRILDTFTGEDAHSVGQFIMLDVVVPTIKNLIVDTITQGTERAINGDTSRRRPGNGRQQYSGGGRTSYNNYSSSRVEPRSERREISQRGRSVHDFDEIVLSTRGEAEQVLDVLARRIDQYGVATVSDLYDLVDITGSFADDKYGWFDMRGAHAQPIRGGYILNMPGTEPID